MIFFVSLEGVLQAVLQPFSICLHLGRGLLTRADLNTRTPPSDGRDPRPSRTSPEGGAG